MIAMGGLKPAVSLYGVVLLLTILSVVLATPAPGLERPLEPRDNEIQTRAQDFYLRIMPLGASITRGEPGDPRLQGRGYRKFLRDRLRGRGWKVNMVGSVKSGENFDDNDNEGWPGHVVGSEDGTGANAVHPKAREFVPIYKPNVVLVNCGTNDGNMNNDLDNIGRRMEAMVKRVFSSSPGVVVVLSTLLPNRDHDPAMEDINAQYRALVARLSNEGYKIQLAEMHNGVITMDQLLDDGIHPNFEGSRRMGESWDTAIYEAESKGWLQPPSQDVDFSIVANSE